MKVEPIMTVNVDGVPHAVDTLSDEVKSLVNLYNEWRQQEADTKSSLIMIQAAMRDISREIIMQIKNDKEAAEAAAAEATAPVEEVPTEVPAVPEVVVDNTVADAPEPAGDA